MTRTLRTSLLLGTLLFAGAIAGTAEAQGGARDGRFGLGGQVGDPTGLSMKLRTQSIFSVQFGFGWEPWGYGRWHNGRDLQIHADFLWSIDVLARPKIDMSFYFGVGPQLQFNTWGGGNDHSNVFAGARVPLGLDFEFTRRRLDVFWEMAPGFLVGDDWDADNNTDVFFDLDVSAGARYWF